MEIMDNVNKALGQIRLQNEGKPHMLSIKMHPETLAKIRKNPEIVGPYWPSPELILGVPVFEDTGIPIGRAKITYEVEV